LIAGAAIASFLITLFFVKRKPEPSPLPALQKNNGNATANATGGAGGNASIGDIIVKPEVHIHQPRETGAASAPAPALVDIEAIRDDARRDAIIDFLKKSPANTGYDVRELSEAVNITMPDVRDIMKALEFRGIVWSVEQLDAVGGRAYFLDQLHRPSPAPLDAATPEQKHNINFDNIWYGEKWQGSPLSIFAGQTLPFATAKFENAAIQGMKLGIPRVKARAIYRRADGTSILDIPQAPWIPGQGNQSHAIFAANTPQYVLLFFLEREKLMCRSVESFPTRTAGRKQRVREGRDYELREPIASIEIQLLTETEQLCGVLLYFDPPTAQYPLPQYRGHKELV